METWKDRVLEEKSSIFNRQKVLSFAIKKLHVLRSLDQLRHFKEISLKRKRHLVGCVEILEVWMTKKLVSSSIQKMRKICVYEDRRDYFLERVTTIVNRTITKNGFSLFGESIERYRVCMTYQKEFEEFRLKKKIKKSLVLWKKMALLRKRLLPVYQE